MAKRKIIITLGFILLTVACGKVVGDMSVDNTGLNKKQVEKATEQYCGNNQVLKEIENGTDVPFGQLNYRTRIFAFVDKSSNKECIINSPVSVTFQDGTWFVITPPNNCLKNGSVWSVDSSTSGSGQYYSMKLIDDSNQRIMNMNGDFGLRGSYVSEKVGLKVLGCMNK